MKEKVEFERFQAKDKDGQVFNIIGYQNYITYSPVYGVPVVLKGDLEYWTDTGLRVTKVDSRAFRISQSEEETTRLIEKLTFAKKKDIEVYADKLYE